jgi:hypothetical protein
LQLTCAQARAVIEVAGLGSLAKRFHAAQQASTLASWLSKTLMARQLARKGCRMFSTGFSSGLQGGKVSRERLSRTTRAADPCQPAPSRMSTAWGEEGKTIRGMVFPPNGEPTACDTQAPPDTCRPCA